MDLRFDKLHGAGNDFIIADDAEENWPQDPGFIRAICDRHKGIGGDGLILVRAKPGADPRMVYFNSDGSRAEMCGNGLRCAASFVYRHGLAGGRRCVRLTADDGEHLTEILDEAGTRVKVSLLIAEEFRPVRLENGETVYKGILGVPHAIAVRPDLEAMDVRKEGAHLRYHPAFQPAGVNVDFIGDPSPDRPGPVAIRTYERGVEDETLACGTGCASTAVVLNRFFGFGEKICLLCRGKDHIEVEIPKECSTLKGVFLSGPAEKAFDGKISV
ncbi:MAG: diaminopimelate epimerase [Lentisphaeria bacterium]|nr:diaminopimelate epimerase [Lentisphaeria bacterium]